MATSPTNNPVPSDAYADLRYNSGVLDSFLNSQQDEFVDRLGNIKHTLKKITIDAPSAQQIEQARVESQQSASDALDSSEAASQSAQQASTSAGDASAAASAAAESSSQASSSASSASASASAAAASAAQASSPNGVTDGSSAAAGKVGELKTASTSPASLASATIVNAATLALTPGVWEVNAVSSFVPSGGSTAVVQISISTTSATFATFPHRVMRGGNSTYATELLARRLFNVNQNTNIYLTAYAELTGGTTATVAGYLEARRIR